MSMAQQQLASQIAQQIAEPKPSNSDVGPVLIIKAKGLPPLKVDLFEPGTYGGGVGGWSRIPRPKRRSLTNWDGVDGYEQEIPVILDGLAQNRSVERDITRLERFGRKGKGRKAPPVLTLKGPIPHTNLEWILQSIQWGDFDRRGDGNRIRQRATLLFWEYVNPNIDISRKKRKKSPAKEARDRGRTRTIEGTIEGTIEDPFSSQAVTVRSGETLSTIAARELGNPDAWRLIGDLNGIRDPKAVRPGQVIRLP